MKRREFMGLVGGAVMWPMTAHAQRTERMRRVAVLIDLPQNDRARPRVSAFIQGLLDLGWIEGQNMQIDIRWGADSPESGRKLSAELLASDPDVILTSGSPATAAMRQTSAAKPIVFTLVADPVGAGFVDSLARPGANVTGFTLFEYSIGGKWLELLKEIAPSVRRVAVLRDANIASGAGQFGALQSIAPSLGVELRPIGLSDTAEIERGFSAFVPRASDGMIVTASSLASVYRDQIIAIANGHRLPSVFPYRHFVAAGGLVSYGPSLINPFQRAASYVSRILKGEKPADLPVQGPTAYELAVNLRAANALGLTPPSTLLSRADEIIE